MADGGIGEAMLISAAIGGGSSALQGRDPLQGALMGGALGGLGAWGAGALGSSFGTAAEAAAAGEAAGSAFAPQAAAGLDTSKLIPTEFGFYDPITMTDVAAPARTASGLAADQINQMSSLNSAAKNAYIQGMNLGGMDPTQAVKEAATANRVLQGPAQGIAGWGEKAANWMAEHPRTVGSTVAGLAQSGLMKPPGLTNVPGTQPYSGPLSYFKYDPRNYNPYTPTPPNPPYRAQYASGGITSLAVGGGLNEPTGPVERMSQGVIGSGGMYPQSQMDKTYFATPTQMPASAEVIGADYDAKTNPYTGAMMAKGGIASLGDIDDIIEEAKTTSGGMANLASKARSDDANALAALAKMEQQKMLKQQHPGLAGGGIAALREGSFVVPADVVSHMGNGSTDAGLAALHKRTGAKPIKGHGDGMSDSIPTTIDGQQQARVADGEAVIEPEQVKRIGKGSSKEGAKKLYSMMDKVRKARTGSTKQGRQINPSKYMPA